MSTAAPARLDLLRQLDQAGHFLERDPVGDPVLHARLAHVLGQAHLKGGRAGKALPLLERALARRRAALGPEHPDTLTTLHLLADACLSARQSKRALPLYQELLDRQRARLGADPLALADLLIEVGARWLDSDEPAVAEPWLREALAIRQRQAPDCWRTFRSASLLGACLLAQGQRTAAEPLLLQGYQGLRLRQLQIPARLRQQQLEQALERLLRISEGRSPLARVLMS